MKAPCDQAELRDRKHKPRPTLWVRVSYPCMTALKVPVVRCDAISAWDRAQPKTPWGIPKAGES